MIDVFNVNWNVCSYLSLSTYAKSVIKDLAVTLKKSPLQRCQIKKILIALSFNFFF